MPDGSSQQAVDVRAEIQRRISDGRIRPGARLVEQRLAEDLGVSRTPVREALISLMTMGHVRRAPGGWEMVRYSVDEVRDAFELRTTIESQAAYRAALRGTKREHADIQASYQRMHQMLHRGSGSRIELAHDLARLNREFHEAVAVASGNSRLPKALEAVVIAPLVFSAFAWYSDLERERSDDSHRAVCDAICRRDAKRAEWLMAEHIMEGWDAVDTHIRVLGDTDDANIDGVWDQLRAAGEQPAAGAAA